MNINGGTYTMGTYNFGAGLPSNLMVNGLGYHYGNSLPTDLRGLGYHYGNSLPSDLAGYGGLGYAYGNSLPSNLAGLGGAYLNGILEDDLALLRPRISPPVGKLDEYSARLVASLRAARSGDNSASLRYFQGAEAFRAQQMSGLDSRTMAEADRLRGELTRMLPTIDDAAVAASKAEMQQLGQRAKDLAAAGSTPEAIAKEMQDREETALSVACPWAYGISYIPGIPFGAIKFACLHGKKIALGAALLGGVALYLHYRKR